LTGFSVRPIPWDLDASFRLPASVWHAAMDQFFPGGGWVRLQRETIDRLQAFRGSHALISWDEAICVLLDRAGTAGQAGMAGEEVRSGVTSPTRRTSLTGPTRIA
jgi:hypothetical protein